MSIHDVPPQELIERTAEALKKIDELKPPAWAQFAKTSSHTEKPPVRTDWWYVRAASILRKIAILGPVGVSKLRVKYGGKKNKGYAPERFMASGGNHIRKILQQLEKAGLAKQEAKGVHKGRVITPKGRGFLDKVAAEIMKERDIVLPKRPDTQLEAMMPKEPRKPRARKAKEAPEKPAPEAEAKPKRARRKPKQPKAAEKSPEVTQPAAEKSPTQEAGAEKTEALTETQ